MIFLVVPYALLAISYFAAARPRGGINNPEGLFVFFNSLAFVGTLLVIDLNSQVDRQYGYLVFAFTSLIVTILTLLRVTSPLIKRSASGAQGVHTSPLRFLVPLYAVSLSVTFAYYLAVGNVTLIDSIRASAASESFDAQTSRLASYAGSRYLFPGYVNQFKNSLLPILSVAIAHTLWVQRNPWRYPLVVALSGVALVAVAGTGQRGALVIVLLTLLIALRKSRLLSGVRAFALVGVGAVLFFSLTVFLGRNEAQLRTSRGAGESIRVLLDSTVSRAVLENPFSGLAAYRYTETLPSGASGTEWGRDLLGVLPSFRGSDLANRVFEQLYGTPRGTAPTSLWGGMFYNFGLLGSVIVIIILALMLHLVARRYFIITDISEYTLIQILCLAGMSVSLGSWIAGSPLTVLNQGFFAYLLLYMFCTRYDPGRPKVDAANKGQQE